jgi:hypothetical protein
MLHSLSAIVIKKRKLAAVNLVDGICNIYVIFNELYTNYFILPLEFLSDVLVIWDFV